MNNRELENYFSLFSRKGCNCVGFCIKGQFNSIDASVSTETTRETPSTVRRQEKS